MANVGISNRGKWYLLKTLCDDITGAKLPSNKQVLQYFLHLHRIQKKPVRTAAGEVVDKLFKFWTKANVPVRHKPDCINQVQKLFKQWGDLKKNSSRNTVTQKTKESEFLDKFEDLFDIAHANALNMILNQEDKNFLIAQREKGRRGTMSSLDRVLLRKQKHQKENNEKTRKRKLAAEEDAVNCKEIVVLDSSTDSSAAESDASECEPGPSASSNLSVKRRGRKEILTAELSAALDRTKTTDRMAMHIIANTAQSLGHNVSELILNRSSIRRKRIQHRSSKSLEILSNFKPNSCLIVHWDSKLMKDVTGQTFVDRLPVLVSGNGISQLLAIAKIPSSAGDAQANAVIETLQQWNITDVVQGMCFDTTSSNTGRHSGACVKIEQGLGQNLLHFACRHHILELLAGAAFKEAMGTSSAPEMLLFKRFHDKWEWIDKQKFEDGMSDDVVRELVLPVKDEVTEFISNALMESQPRDDYREVLELASIFLGTPPSGGVHFSAPGAMHHARWMAKVIYSFKVWMFRSQFKLTPKESQGLRNLCIFFATVYVKTWTLAHLAVKAPNEDLKLLKALQQYKSVNETISKATFQKMSGHLWYLSEELVALAFFDDTVSLEEKSQMLLAMKAVDGDEEPAKRIKIDSDALQEKALHHFATKNTVIFSKAELENRLSGAPNRTMV